MPSRSGYLEILSWCTDLRFPRVCAPEVLLPVFPWLAANAAFRSSCSYEVCVSPRGECHFACLLKESFCCSFLLSCGLGLTLQLPASGIRLSSGLARAQLVCLCVAPALRAGRRRLILINRAGRPMALGPVCCCAFVFVFVSQESCKLRCLSPVFLRPASRGWCSFAVCCLLSISFLGCAARLGPFVLFSACVCPLCCEQARSV